jgi:hypothetical protein
MRATDLSLERERQGSRNSTGELFRANSLNLHFLTKHFHFPLSEQTG